MNFGTIADAARGVLNNAAEYGEQLKDHTPASLTDATWAWTPDGKTDWDWVDAGSDHFGKGEQTFVVKKGSDDSVAYNAVTFNVEPRTVMPVVRFGNTGGDVAPSAWTTGNINKAKATDSTYKMTITGVANDATMGTVKVDGIEGSKTLWKGQTVTLTAEAKDGYKLKQWSTGSTSSSITVTPYTDATYTATFEANGTMTVTSSLPTKSGDVSIMTLAQAFTALNSSGNTNNDSKHHYDPNPGYSNSTYYMYAVNDIDGTDYAGSESTAVNLQAVGLSWYQQLKKPIAVDNYWKVGNHKVFGGPLSFVYYSGSGYYRFVWYYSESSLCYSDGSDYCNGFATGSVCVAVVHK